MPTTDPRRFRHRTAEVEAVQWTGSNTEQMRAFCGPDFDEIDPEDRGENPDATAAVRESTHGEWQRLEPGWWVVKIGDELYEESDADFVASFEPVVSSPPATDRATVYAEVAARLLADAEQGAKDGFTRIYRRSAADRVRVWADEMAVGARQPDTETQAVEAHPPEHTWAAELYDPLAEEWVPGTRYPVRERAVNALAHSRRLGPTWKDGTPTQRRLMRTTTTYTVEAEDAPASSAVSGRSAATDTHEETPRQSCACGQDGCEYCDVEDADEETGR